MMTEQFLQDLRATRDRGLPISFDDVLAGAASALAKTAGDERYMISCIEDACRRRLGVNRPVNETGWPSATAGLTAAPMRDKTGAPLPR